MTSREQWLADRCRFVSLVTDRDPTGEIPLAIRIDLTPEEVAVIAPGATSFDAMQTLCQRWVENFLAPTIERMEAHLAFESKERRR